MVAKGNRKNNPSCLRMAGVYTTPASARYTEKGNVLFYVFLALGLLAALTYSFVNTSRDNVTSQGAYRTAEKLYSQVSLIRSAIVQCSLEYPGGGGDLNGDGVINSSDNPNNPYPVDPTDANNPFGAAANDQVSNVTCTGAPSGQEVLFGSSANGTARFLPAQVTGFSNWVYINDSNGVRIQTIAPSTAEGLAAITRLQAKFGNCEADINYNSCGTYCFDAWISRKTCP